MPASPHLRKLLGGAAPNGRQRSSSASSILTVNVCWEMQRRRRDPCQSLEQAAHRKLHRAVRRPEAVGNPLHNVVVRPFRLPVIAGVDLTSTGALDACRLAGLVIGALNVYRVRHAHHLAAR